MLKQVIVVNKNLNMPMGKFGGQVAHASMSSYIQSFKISDKKLLKEWEEDDFKTKIVCYVKSEEKLLNILTKAKDKGLPCALVKDAGKTFFNDPTITCIGIGPAYIEDFIGVTDKLRIME